MIPKVLNDFDLYRTLIEHFDNVNFYSARILITAPYMMPNIEIFVRFLEEKGCKVLVAPVLERLNQEELSKYHGEYDIALIGDDQYNSDVLVNCKAKVLSKWGTGIDSIDQTIAKRLGISVCNTPDAFSEPVAESILGALLSFNRTLLQSNYLMAGETKGWAKIPGRTLAETVVGIIGVGNVGECLLSKLVALGCKTIIVYDILDVSDKVNLYQYKNKKTTIKIENELKNLLKNKLNFLCTTCCLTDDNVKMLSTTEFDLLEKYSDGGCYLINNARGKLIDEPALIKALEDGQIAGAGLDVFWDEPLAEDSVLRKMAGEKVIITSHNSNSSPLAWKKVHIKTIENGIKEFSKIKNAK